MTIVREAAEAALQVLRRNPAPSNEELRPHSTAVEDGKNAPAKEVSFISPGGAVPAQAVEHLPQSGILAWPEQKFKDSEFSGKGKRGGIIEFLRGVWKPLFEREVIITREALNTIDDSSGIAVNRYLRYHELPHDIKIFTYEQMNEYLSKKPMSIRPASMECQCCHAKSPTL